MYYIWPFDGSITAHPNSLLFNAVPLYWPFKVFWFFRKVSSKMIKMEARVANRCACFVFRLARSSPCKTSPLLPRATPTMRNLAATSASLSSTESVRSNKPLQHESPFTHAHNNSQLRSPCSQSSNVSQHPPVI